MQELVRECVTEVVFLLAQDVILLLQAVRQVEMEQRQRIIKLEQLKLRALLEVLVLVRILLVAAIAA